MLSKATSWSKKVLVARSCPTLCNPMDCSLPNSSVHGVLQARILEWVAIPFSRGSSWPRDWTWVSCSAGSLFIIWATREAMKWEGNIIFFTLTLASHGFKKWKHWNHWQWVLKHFITLITYYWTKLTLRKIHKNSNW